MKLNRKLEIALKALDILKTKRGHTRTEDMVVEADTTIHLLEHVMRELRIAGIVTVKRGPGGGYTLNTAGDFSAYHVAMAVGRDFGELKFDESPSSRLSKSIVDAFLSTKI